jgi:hypothetical protein
MLWNLRNWIHSFGDLEVAYSDRGEEHSLKNRRRGDEDSTIHKCWLLVVIQLKSHADSLEKFG